MELLRKSIHSLGLTFPILGAIFGREFLLMFLVISIVSFLVLEGLRISGIQIPIYSEIIWMSLRDKEDSKKPFLPTFYFLLSSLVLLLIFWEKIEIFYSSVSILSVGDSVSSIVGASLGRRKLPYPMDSNKTIEGSASFLLSSFLVSNVFLDWKGALASSLIACFFEAIGRVNDNLSVPFSSALGPYLSKGNLMATLVFSSFLITFLLSSLFAKKFPELGIFGVDLHKLDKPKVAEMGGISIFLGLVPVLLILGRDELFLVALISVTIGVIDDLVQLRQRDKVMLCALASIPLFPRGEVLGFQGLLAYFLMAMGITGGSNAFNLLAGFNGLEAGLSLILFSFSCMFLKGDLLVISACISLSLIAFLYFNWYPARIFPGDSGTLLLGAMYSSLAILGNSELVMALFLIPHMADLLLKSKSRFGTKKIGPTVISENGFLIPPKYSSLISEILKRRRFKEVELVLLLLGVQLATCGVISCLFLAGPWS
ncbi:hypothetical protein DRN46_02335 [Thermococci archaeon]|nr:MAG: hypothetical protein DRN46_02335 [Thermococci archaeon]